MSQTIPSGVEFTHFVHEAQKRGYTSVAAYCSPSESALGAYFYDEQPNLLVLSAKTKSATDGVLGVSSGMLFVESSLTVVAISSDLIPEDAFQIPSDWKVKKDSQPVGWSFRNLVK